MDGYNGVSPWDTPLYPSIQELVKRFFDNFFQKNLLTDAEVLVDSTCRE
jgi:hypothetical protein